MVTLGDLAHAGPTHHIIGSVSGGDAGGRFEWTPLNQLAVKPAQVTLVAADSKTQTSVVTEPTHGGTIIDAEAASQLINQRSNWFVSRNLRWTSQAISFAYTENLAHGGRVWNAMQKLDDEVGRCIALWCNSVFGGIVRNAYGQTTQAGRATIQVNSIPGIPCPDFGADTTDAAKARSVASQHFDELARLALEPFAFCFRDENRHRIDDVVAEMIGSDPRDPNVREMLARYRLMFSREPNVNGRNRAVLGALSKL